MAGIQGVGGESRHFSRSLPLLHGANVFHSTWGFAGTAVHATPSGSSAQGMDGRVLRVPSLSVS